jgi:hypothetical protein
LAWTCVFSKQSLPPALCGHTTLHPQGASRVRPPFSLSYGGNLPSSLTTVHPSPRYSLPDHLCRFRVRAARSSLEAFLDSIGSRYFASIGYASGLRSTRRRIYLPTLPTPLHQYYHSLAALPSCVTPSLDYYRIGSRAHHKPNRSRAMDRAVSITGLVIGAPSRVREYQPVVHRLRLSASP